MSGAVDMQAIVEHRMRAFEEEMREVRQAMRDLVAVTARQTALIDNLASIRKDLDDHEGRLREVEKHQPQLRETRTWVITASAAAASAVLTFALNIALAPTKQVTLPPRESVITDRAKTP